MKQKRAVSILVISLIIFSIFLISALTDEEKVEEAYDCLEEKVGTSCNLDSTQKTTFSLMALSYNSTFQENCLENLDKSISESNNFTCWKATSSGSCDIKSTALAVIALDYLGQDTEKAQNWLLDKKIKPTNVEWYLEIDSDSSTSCEIYIDGGDIQNFNINEDKTLTKSSGSSNCLTLASNLGNYFIKIDPSCYSSTFETKCNENFITTLLYQRQGSAIYYVSSATNLPDSQGFTTEKINSYCLGISSCDYESAYEGTLWGALALDKTGRDVSELLPYINIGKDEGSNNKFLPSAFLYFITGSSNFLSETMLKQTGSYRYGYWDVSGDKFYDTALGIYSTRAEEAKDYLLTTQEETGTNKGCWSPSTSGDMITDTAFILLAGWPKPPIDISEPEVCEPQNCTDLGYECGDWDDGCDNNINCGNCTIKYGSGFYCSAGTCINDTVECTNECTSNEKKCTGDYLRICGNYNTDSCLEWSPLSHNDTIRCPEDCEDGKCVNDSSTTVSDRDDCEDAGNFCLIPGDCASGCSSDEHCSVSEVSAYDTNYCCLGTCEQGTEQENDCEAKGNNCRISCRDGEEIVDYDCEFSSDVCCSDESSGGGSKWLLIILLIILIILVILAIIFRKQLKMWWFKMKSKFRKGKGPSPTTRPGMPPPRYPRPMPRQSKDTVFDNTMKKLKDMTK